MVLGLDLHDDLIHGNYVDEGGLLWFNQHGLRGTRHQLIKFHLSLFDSLV